MKITRRSFYSGEIHTMEMDVTPHQIAEWLGGELIQRAMPNLTPDEREFIKTGILPNEWEQLHGTSRTDH